MPEDLRVTQLVEAALDGSRTPEELCADCPDLLPAVLCRLREIHGRTADLQHLFPTKIPTIPDSQPGGAASPSGDVVLDLRGYELLDRVGRGGMGEVFRGKDPALGRDLAVKVLRPELRGRADAESRFQQEARVTGALQHPNIVPVHNLGRLPDDRLYFTMKLVRGRTLADLLTERTGAGRLAELLGVFEKVCQAVAFAHSRGVIHRDLKPANIMVGAFGEVQVMDWGLAKVLPSDPGSGGPGVAFGEGGDTVRRVWRTPSEDDWTTGIVGTPAYMPPEQARGAADEMDERADVFGLGAILCEILTGRPPYAGTSSDAILRRAASGDTDEILVCLNACGADAELVALCRECLATERTARPQHGQTVAERVLAYQAGVQERLKMAELERAAAEAREQEAQVTARAERKARQRTWALAAAVLLLVLLAAGGWLWWERAQETQRIKTRQRIDVAVGKAEYLTEQAQAAARQPGSGTQTAVVFWEQALGAVEQADSVLAVGLADEATLQRLADLRQQIQSARLDARARLEQERKDATLMTDLDLARLRGTAIVDGHLDFEATLRGYEEAFRRYGIDVGEGDVKTLVARFQACSLTVQRQVVPVLDYWALTAGPGPLRERLRETALDLDSDPRRARWVAALANGNLDTLRQLASESRPEPLPALHVELLCAALERQGAREEQVAMLRQAQRIYPADFWIHFNLAEVLHRTKDEETNRLEEAIGCYRAALALRPQTSVVYSNLGLALYDKQDLEGAIAACQKAIDLDPKSSFAHNNLGIALNARKDPDGALAEYQKAVALDEKAPYPHYNLGSVLADKRDLDGAIAEYQKAIALDPKLGKAHNNLGLIWFKKGNPDEAIAEFKKAIEIDDHHINAHVNLGAALANKGKMDEAIAVLQNAIRLDPRNSSAHRHLANAFEDKADLDGALAEYQKAIDLDPSSAKAHYGLGSIWARKKQLDQAIQEYRRAIELDPTDAEPHDRLGTALFYKHQLDNSIEEHGLAIKLDPTRAMPHNNLGLALREKGQVEEAIKEFHRAIELDPRLALPHGALGQTLLQLGRFAEARESTRRCLALIQGNNALRLGVFRQLQQCEAFLTLDQKLTAILKGGENPANDAERLALAQLCQQPFKKLYTASCRFYEEAFAHNARLADDMQQQHRYNAACAAALAGCGQGSDDTRDAKEHARLRHQALVWLRADLAHWNKQVASEKPSARELAQKTLKHWQDDTDLAGLRDKDAVAKLPADERQACQEFWSDVDALLRKARDEK